MAYPKKISMDSRAITSDSAHKKWFFFLLCYLFVDYGRPQDILPVGFLRPGMIMILILTWYIVSSNKIKLADSKQTRLICAFVILTAIYIPIARNNFFAYITTRTMLLYMPFILSTIILVDSIKRLRTIVSFMIIVMVYVCFYSLFHLGQGSGNYFKDENDLSLYINTMLPFCYFLLLCEKSAIKKAAYGLSLLIGLLSVITSFSRGGFVGLICMIAIAWWFSPRKLVALVLICLLGGIGYYYGGVSYRKEIVTVTETDSGTAKERTESWKAAWKMFLDNPLGVGGNNFQARFHEYQTDYFKRGMWGRVAHSLWFTLIPELGLVGTFLYLSLLYYNLKDIFFLKSIKTNDDPNLRYMHFLSLAFIASLAGYFASATFISVLYYPHYWYLTAILVATKRLVAGNMQTSSSLNSGTPFEKAGHSFRMTFF